MKFKFKKKAKENYIDQRFKEMEVPTLEVVQLSALDDDELSRELKISNQEVEIYKAESDSILEYKRYETENKKSKREMIGKIAQATAYVTVAGLVLFVELNDEKPRSMAHGMMDKFMKV